MPSQREPTLGDAMVTHRGRAATPGGRRRGFFEGLRVDEIKPPDPRIPSVSRASPDTQTALRRIPAAMCVRDGYIRRRARTRASTDCRALAKSSGGCEIERRRRARFAGCRATNRRNAPPPFARPFEHEPRNSREESRIPGRARSPDLTRGIREADVSRLEEHSSSVHNSRPRDFLRRSRGKYLPTVFSRSRVLDARETLQSRQPILRREVQ